MGLAVFVLLFNVFSYAFGVTTVSISANEETQEAEDGAGDTPKSIRVVYNDAQKSCSGSSDTEIKDRDRGDNFDKLSLAIRMQAVISHKMAEMGSKNLSESGCKVRQGIFHMKLQSDDDEHPLSVCI